MKYFLVTLVLLFTACFKSPDVEKEFHDKVLSIATTIALERYGSFTSVACYVDFYNSTFTNTIDGQGDVHRFYPCQVFAPSHGSRSEQITDTIYCSVGGCMK